MRRILIVIALLLFIAGCISTSTVPQPQNPQPQKIKEEKVGEMEKKELILKLPYMTCQGCAYSVESTLKNKKGVVDVEVDFPQKRATVIYDPSQTNEEEIINDPIVKAYGGERI